MPSTFGRIAALLLGTALLAACQRGAIGSGAGANAQDEGAAEIVKVLQKFDQAISAGDTSAAIALLHPDLVVYESGYVEPNRDAFARSHLLEDIEFARTSTKKAGAPQIFVAQSGDMAYAVSTYGLSGTFRGKSVDSEGTETMIFARTPEGWKIRHAHWSGHRREAAE